MTSRTRQAPPPPEPRQILLHGHCHQKSMGLLPAAKALLSRVPGATVIDPDAGCCGMAGSFGYDHYDLSQTIGSRVLFPAIREHQGGPFIAPGFSCRHQISDGTGQTAVHPLSLLLQYCRSGCA